MKKLILLSVFVTTSLFAAGPVQEIATGADASQIVSKIKDVEVSGMLEQTAEFNECRRLYQYKEGDDSKNEDNLKKAESCFREKLSKETNKDKLKQMSESLNLQQYGLVPSNNVKDVQNYLTNKMYKSLTGVDRDERDKQKLADSLKFGKKKNVDQKVFIELYKTQLGKNALYEVSRFCFESFRLKTAPSTAKTFSEYWSGHVEDLDITKVTDSGSPSFYNFDDTSDKSKILNNIFSNISTGDKGLDKGELEVFFIKCGKLMVQLCDKYQFTSDKAKDSTENGTTSKLGYGTGNLVTEGAASCLAKNRVQEYKQALVNAEKLETYFNNEMKADQKTSLMLKGLKGEPIKIFGQGDASEPTVDDLTNNTAASTLETYQEDQATKDKAEACKNSQSIDDCKDFITQGDQLEKTKQKIELEMTLKRDVEMARVRELVNGDKKDLRQYLQDGGYFEILKKLDEGTLDASKIEGMIGQVFEAKKEATLIEINKKLGSRQIKKDEKTVTDAKAIVEESTQERARLAQVVLFNNIITSHLDLKKKGETASAGRNVNAIKKETAELGGKVNSAYFQNVKSDANSATGIGRDSQISGFQILDMLLGQDDKQLEEQNAQQK